MDDRQVLPEGLANLLPGPGLAAVLGTIDRTRLFGADLNILLKSRARQVAYEQAQLLADMLETAYTPGEGDTLDRTRSLDEFSGDQVAFELRWSRSAVAGHLSVTQDLIERLPVVYHALTAGRIDLVRARAFSEALAVLDDEKAQLIAARLIDRAQNWTAGQLRERLRYHVLKADPDAAKARYQFCVADRRVYNQPYTDGTAELGGVNLPPDRAAAAFDRIERLAQAAKSDGDVRTLAQLRADAFLDLLVGRVFQLRPGTDPLTQAADQAARDDDPGVNDTTADPTQPKPRRRSGTRPSRGFTAGTARTPLPPAPPPPPGRAAPSWTACAAAPGPPPTPPHPAPPPPDPTPPHPTRIGTTVTASTRRSTSTRKRTSNRRTTGSRRTPGSRRRTWSRRRTPTRVRTSSRATTTTRSAPPASAATTRRRPPTRARTRCPTIRGCAPAAGSARPPAAAWSTCRSSSAR